MIGLTFVFTISKIYDKVFPKTVREAITSWRGTFMGKKRKKIRKGVPLCIFWTIWKERNRIAFNDGTPVVQRLKFSFIYNLWGWYRIVIGVEVSSVVDFLDWLASS